MSYRGSGEKAVFPDRECEACGRKGGGDPDAGLDNVVLHGAVQLCGHHVVEFEDWFYAKKAEALAKWVSSKKPSAA